MNATYLFGKRTTILLMGLVLILSLVGQVGFITILILFLIFYRVKKTTLYQLGLTRPQSWVRTIVLGFLLATAIIVAIKGLEYLFFGNLGEPDVSRFDIIKTNPIYLFFTLLFVWITAGLGEEIIWRGFMMNNMAILFGNSSKAWMLSLLVTSVIFGSIHLYQGWVGVLQTGLAGLFLGIIYIKNGKYNLWLNVFTHGFIDTISLTYLYLT